MSTVRSRRRTKATAVKQSSSRRKAANKDVESLEIENVTGMVEDCWRPTDWRLVWTNTETMRRNKAAPVDTIGCCKLFEPEADPKTRRYQLLVSLMLSSQTKDAATAAAMERLKQHGCSLEKILAMSEEQLGKLIYPVSFWRTKAKAIKKTSLILLEKYGGDIPQTAQELFKLPGVGPKMAYLALRTGWNKCEGIAVDTHVHRISNRLGWVPTVTKTPEQTRKALENWLPKEHWPDIHELFVGFGQTICLPRNPKCQSCLNAKICPYARSDKLRKQIE